jgi:hypothetical protein
MIFDLAWQVQPDGSLITWRSHLGPNGGRVYVQYWNAWLFKYDRFGLWTVLMNQIVHAYSDGRCCQ